MRETITAEEAAALVPDGARVMIGGVDAVGTPERVIDALVARGVRDLTVIASDTAHPGAGIGKLIDAGCVARMIVSRIGTNPVAQRKMMTGEIAVDLVPPAILAERIRSGGAGLGGVLMPTGPGTTARRGTRVIEIEGSAYLLETPLHAEIALIRAHTADHCFNLAYAPVAMNLNPLMAMAADCVIAEPDKVVPVGMIPAEAVHSSGVLIDYLVGCPS